MKKFNANLNIKGILANPQEDWNRIKRAAQGNVRVAFRKLDVDWKKYTTDNYLFTHDTIVCSVETEPNHYWIKKPCEELVNANGNAWSNEVLLGCFKTFVGGENFLEHVQQPSLSKGKILDAIIRPVVHHSEKYGDAHIYMVDILVATNRKHADLVHRIESGKLSTMSMGCLADKVQCSICGKIIGDGERECEHLERHLGKQVVCEDGETRICAELCGCLDKDGNFEEGSCEFIEASWVDNPAFPGAVLNEFVETPEIKEARESEERDLAHLFDGNLFERLKVADKESNLAIKVVKKFARIDRIAQKVACTRENK